MKLPIRSLATRTASAAVLAAAAAIAFAPSAGASTTDTNPVDDVVGVAAQFVYPDAMPEDFTAQERLDGFLGLNNYPGGPLGSWGPDGGVGLYGQLASITGPPLNTNTASSDDDPMEELLGPVADIVFGPSEDSETTETMSTGQEPESFSPTGEPEQPPGPRK